MIRTPYSNPIHLDLYKKETYQFVDSLLDEYLSGDNPVFTVRISRFHTCRSTRQTYRPIRREYLREAVSTPLQEVGYPYSVEFQLCPEKTNPISSILFQGPHSVVYTNWEVRFLPGLCPTG